MNLRELILQILLEEEKSGQFTGVILTQVLDKYDYLDNTRKGRIKRMVSGVTERRIELDHIIDQFSKTPVKKMKPFIRALMRMSTYEILFMESGRDFAVCNEAVSLAKKHKFGQLSGFVNGVLRSIVRGKDDIPYPDEQKEPMKSLSIRCSMPEEILKIWMDAYGFEKTRQMAYAQLGVPSVTFRMRTDLSKAQQESLLSRMKEEHLPVKQHPYLPYAYTVTGIDKVTLLPGFAEGLITIQDVSSMLPAEYAGIREGDLVIDLCASPGGKSLLASEKCGETGHVISRDLTEEKLERIRENADRMGRTNITVEAYDATNLDESLVGKADVILADLPCSGLGVLKKKQDIKYHVTKESIQELSALQRQILRTCVAYLKPGGKLMYSTCTVTPAENDEQADFLEKEMHLTPICFAADAHPEDKALVRLQIFPGDEKTADMDGFFLALFQKNE